MKHVMDQHSVTYGAEVPGTIQAGMNEEAKSEDVVVIQFESSTEAGEEEQILVNLGISKVAMQMDKEDFLYLADFLGRAAKKLKEFK